VLAWGDETNALCGYIVTESNAPVGTKETNKNQPTAAERQQSGGSTEHSWLAAVWEQARPARSASYRHGVHAPLEAELVHRAPGDDDDLVLPWRRGPGEAEGAAGRAQPAVDGRAVLRVGRAADRRGRDVLERAGLAQRVDADEGGLRRLEHVAGEVVGGADDGGGVLGAGGERAEAVASLALPPRVAHAALAPRAKVFQDAAVAATQGAVSALGAGPAVGALARAVLARRGGVGAVAARADIRDERRGHHQARARLDPARVHPAHDAEEAPVAPAPAPRVLAEPVGHALVCAPPDQRHGVAADGGGRRGGGVHAGGVGEEVVEDRERNHPRPAPDQLQLHLKHPERPCPSNLSHRAQLAAVGVAGAAHGAARLLGARVRVAPLLHNRPADRGRERRQHVAAAAAGGAVHEVLRGDDDVADRGGAVGSAQPRVEGRGGGEGVARSATALVQHGEGLARDLPSVDVPGIESDRRSEVGGLRERADGALLASGPRWKAWHRGERLSFVVVGGRHCGQVCALSGASGGRRSHR
jgi:hypothetical protein